MYNLLEYSFNYSYTGCLFFYFKDEVINFNADIADNSKSFSFKAKFLGNRAADGEKWNLETHDNRCVINDTLGIFS